MGTNFYWLPPAVTASYPPVAGDVPASALHIGKRSGVGGGLCSFCLQGHNSDVDAVIDTWAKWKVVLRSGGTVRDEYGDVHPTEDFISEVEGTTPTNRSRLYDYVQEALGVVLEQDAYWLCPDGFSFTYHYFS